MCGIFGQVGSSFVSSSRASELMATALQKRGPDHTGVFSAPGVFLGNTRLAIVDLSMGNQPIFNEDRSLVIVFNGEIYNHAQIRQDLISRGHVFSTNSDTEAILHAFEEYGPSCVTRLNGMFTIAIWNIRESFLFLARDRFGIKPLYLWHSPQSLAFASEAKALLPLLPRTPEPDWTAVSRYFTFGYVPSPVSPFKGIKKLSPGHFAIFRQGKFEVTKFWAPEFGAGPSMDWRTAQREVSHHLEAAVRAELMSDVPVGVFLSGGLDSSAVAVIAKRFSEKITHSFSIGFEESTHDESRDAWLVARHLGLEHHECRLSEDLLWDGLRETIDYLDEPFGDSTVIPLLLLSKFARPFVKVVLTGWGGDEIFAGYPTLFAHLVARRFRSLPAILSQKLIPWLASQLPVQDTYMSLGFKARKFLQGMEDSPELQHFAWMGYFDEQETSRFFLPDIRREVTEPALAPVHQALSEIDAPQLLDRIMNLDARFFLEGNGLFQADRMTMAASLEARVPLLNSHLVDFLAPLPTRIKMPWGKTKELFRRALTKHLPQTILQKPKKGFGPPSSAWIRGVFSPLVKTFLNQERLRAQGIFHPETMATYLEEHEQRVADHGRKIWALLSFQLWYEKWIQGISAERMLDYVENCS